MLRDMKILLTVLVLMVGNMLFSLQLCCANSLIRVNGHTYIDEKLNYLIWDTGSHGGSAVDLSSATIVKESENMMLIAALDYFMNYDKDTIKPIGYLYLYENKKTKSYYFKTARSINETKKWIEYTNMIGYRNSLDLVKSKAIDHRISSE